MVVEISIKTHDLTTNFRLEIAIKCYSVKLKYQSTKNANQI